MSNNNNDRFSMGNQLPKATTRGLIGKQSVRATFRLTKECIRAIQIVSVHLGIKQKSLFDHLMEDETALTFIAERLGDMDFDQRKSVQKTYIISRNTLNKLDKIALRNNASRNAIIEFSVKRLLPIITQERKKHQLRKKILEHIKVHFKKGTSLLNKAGKTLGTNDVMYENLESVMFTYQQKINEMAIFVEKGSLIEKFEGDEPSTE